MYSKVNFNYKISISLDFYLFDFVGTAHITEYFIVDEFAGKCVMICVMIFFMIVIGGNEAAGV